MKLVIIVFSALMFVGCNRYFKPVNVKAPSKESIAQFIDSNKVFIVHDYSHNYELKSPRLNNEGTALTGELKKIKGFRVTQGSRNRIYYHYRPAKPDSIITKQVHLFTSQKLTTTTGLVTHIPLDVVSRIEALEFDKRKTSRRNVGLAIGVLVGAGVAVATIAAMSTIAWWLAPL